MTCFVSDGKVRCAGANDVGQLSRGAVSTTANTTFETVTGLTGPTAVAVGGTHACAIVPGAAGKPTMKCWGANDFGQLGTGVADATPSASPMTVIAAKK